MCGGGGYALAYTVCSLRRLVHFWESSELRYSSTRARGASQNDLVKMLRSYKGEGAGD